jgi:predicted nucleotidyltransferase
MPHYGWHNCPATVREQVDLLPSRLSAILAERLIGIYLHGSLAMGCFNPSRSDLDVLVITSDTLSLTTKRQLIEHLLSCSQRPQPIEISFLARSQLLPWRYPTPYDLHYSETWREAFIQDLTTGAWQAWHTDQQYDPDLAAHITVTNARGICLVGEPIPAVFPAVPDGDYRASIAGDIRDSLETIAANPVYAVLNCCRTYAYHQEGHIFSKEEGGRWALQVISPPLRETVISALAAYRSDAEEQAFNPDALMSFATYMRRELAPLLGHQTPE